MKTLFEFLINLEDCVHALIVIKPGFLQYEEEILNIFKDAGWRIDQMRTTQLTLEQAHTLYEPHKEEDFYEDLCKYMSSGSCTAVYLCKNKSESDKDPLKEVAKIKDEIRDKWSESEMRNVIHSTDDPNRLPIEAGIFF